MIVVALSVVTLSCKSTTNKNIIEITDCKPVKQIWIKSKTNKKQKHILGMKTKFQKPTQNSKIMKQKISTKRKKKTFWKTYFPKSKWNVKK